MDLRVLFKFLVKGFILSLLFEAFFCVPVFDAKVAKGTRIFPAMQTNQVFSKHNRVRERIFDIIMKANSARKGDVGPLGEHGSEVADKVELFQGDIVMTDDIKTALKYSATDEMVLPRKHKTRRGRGRGRKGGRRQRRAASAKDEHKWPVVNGSRQVPYAIESTSVPDQSVIKQAISHWTQKVPCITFVPRTTQNDYISFFAGQGCYSWTGRTGGKQRISIGSGCANMGVIAHEIGHALGFWHEQSRPDRDSYVRILWSNIQIEKVGDFKKIMNGGTNDLGVAYDFNSLMHYGPTAFAKAVGLNTIEKLNGNTDFGQTNGLSDKDIEQARLLYCPGTNACSSLYADSNGSCAGWAALGHCDNPTYKAFMDTNCKKSCVCGVCEDKHVNCAAYVAGGYCTNQQYKAFMEAYCRKGCGLCT